MNSSKTPAEAEVGAATTAEEAPPEDIEMNQAPDLDDAGVAAADSNGGTQPNNDVEEADKERSKSREPSKIQIWISPSRKKNSSRP